MIFRSVLSWFQEAPEGSRVQAASALARAYLFSELSDEDRSEAEATLTFMLEDSSVAVREELAKIFSRADGAPAHIISGLLCDEDRVALPLLRNTLAISEGELIDIAATGNVARAGAIAQRPDISASLSAAICEVAPLDACVKLLRNQSAKILKGSYFRLIERFGSCSSLQQALLEREGVPLAVRHRLVRQYAESLRDHPLVKLDMHSQDPEHMVQDAQDRATLRFASDASENDLKELIEQLVADGNLTSLLLLRAVCCGHLRFIEMSLQRLSGLSQERVERLLASPYSSSFTALLGKAGIPERVQRLFSGALDSWNMAGDLDIGHWEKARIVVGELLEMQQELGVSALGDLQDLLIRLSHECARQSAKERVVLMMAEAA
ncbi:DUF2336 domain-containing protein [Rhodobacteraceae bacterium RKSG542]|uniref:DUF2336 domain-containing protein n=1 Tax=Pseudovibrio flavus TaxID=2529854 RepID=UPI0012BBE1ED|nr:DUF2336 domain-containing protein [Pseudovibrio flavus]MTI19378.1 DUF2336 domain-containing protein [Pseudovibrio flavus]